MTTTNRTERFYADCASPRDCDRHRDAARTFTIDHAVVTIRAVHQLPCDTGTLTPAGPLIEQTFVVTLPGAFRVVAEASHEAQVHDWASGRPGGEFSLREAREALKGRAWVDAASILLAVQRLTAHGLAVEVPGVSEGVGTQSGARGPGRPASTRYRLTGETETVTTTTDPLATADDETLRACPRLYGAGTDPARQLLDWALTLPGRPAEFTAREAREALNGRRWVRDGGAAAVDAALAELEHLGRISVCSVSPPPSSRTRGRPESTRYRLTGETNR